VESLEAEATRQGAAPSRARRLLPLVCGIGVLALLAAFQVLPRDLSPGLQLALDAAGTQALLLLVAVGWAGRGEAPVLARLGLRPGRIGPGGVLLLAVGLLGLSHGIDQAISALGLRELSHLPRIDAAVAGESSGSWAPMLLALVLLPAVVEEIFFRGLLQGGLVARIGAPGAVVAASAIFAAFHGDWVHSAGAFLLGLYLGAVTQIGRSVRPAIGCHLLNNGAALVGVVLPLHALLPAGVLALVGPALAALALALVARRARHAGAPPEPA